MCSADYIIAAQITLTVLIMTSMVFILGFFADPILNLYFDPWSTLMPWTSSSRDFYYEPEEETDSWAEHFAKGFAGMGVLGFLKVIVTSPLSYFRIGGGGRGRTTGRDRYEQVSWIIILIGVGTFLAVCISSNGSELIRLTQHRPFTKASASGAVAHSRELASESWTCKAMMTMMSSVCYAIHDDFFQPGPYTGTVIRTILNCHGVSAQYRVN